MHCILCRHQAALSELNFMINPKSQELIFFSQHYALSVILNYMWFELIWEFAPIWKWFVIRLRRNWIGINKLRMTCWAPHFAQSILNHFLGFWIYLYWRNCFIFHFEWIQKGFSKNINIWCWCCDNHVAFCLRMQIWKGKHRWPMTHVIVDLNAFVLSTSRTNREHFSPKDSHQNVARKFSQKNDYMSS